MCSGFPPPQAALLTVASGKKGFWVLWCNSAEVRVKEQGKSALTGFNMCKDYQCMVVGINSVTV